MAMPPPSPPSPPEGDGTPDAGNPAGVSPPEVAPKPGRQPARKGAGAEKKPAGRAKRTPAKAKSAKVPAAPRKPAKPRATAQRHADARPRPRTTGLSAAATPARQPVDAGATDPAARSRGRWWKAIAGGLGALAAGAALLTLRGSSRRKPPGGNGGKGKPTAK